MSTTEPCTEQATTEAVESIMVREVITVTPDVAITYAANLMNEHDIRHLVVTDKVQRVVGIVSSRDILKYLARVAWQNNNLAGKFPVQEVMVENPTTVLPSQSIHEIAGLLADKKLGCVPVADEIRRLVGFLSAVDVLRYFSKQDQ